MKVHPIINKISQKVLSVLVALASVLASFYGTPAHAEDLYVPDYQAMAEEIVILVNEARAENGLNPVYMVPVLNEAGLVRAMETAGYFSHKRPDNSSFATVFDEYQISYKAAAENIAAGSSTAEETFNQWKNSPNHWKTILNESYTHMGVGVYYDPDSDYWWYWEQLFIASDEVFEGQTLPERYKVVPAGFGDIDGDGVITSLDYTLLLKLIQKKVVLNDLQIESADCMRDGAVTIADAIVLKKYLLHFYDDLPRYP